MSLAISVFSIPWLLLILWVQAHSPAQFSPFWRCVSAVLFAVAAAGGGFGHFELVNAFSGSSIPAVVKGPVVKMEKYSGRWIGTRRIVTIQFQDDELELSQTEEEYKNTKVGDTFGREMKLGGLGYYYRWGLAFWK